MSGFRGRSGPNLSNFLTDLNTTSPTEQQFVDENDFSNDLAMFTNTDFTNLDMPTLGQDDSFNFDLSPDAQAQDSLKYEELLAGPGPMTDFANYTATNTTTATTNAAQTQPYYSAFTTPILPTPIGRFAQADALAQYSNQVTPDRSRAETVQSPDSYPMDEKSRVAAEEDKRRRNTAASARFRVKKKQREQALEKTLKETQDKSSKLASQVTQLEMENRWLKALITEKNGLQSKEEMAAAYEQHRKESEERELKQEPGRTSGVGTS